MITLKTITIKNFFSIGAVTQAVDLTKENLTLVLGENLDQGGESEAYGNAAGKTTLINAISYALYGQSLSNVKKANLINKTNRKNMVVTLEFEKNSTKYRIERGRNPTFLKYFVNDQEQAITDEAQGDSRQTQHALNELIGMKHDMFVHIVALNTYTRPFLSLGASDQRNIIEQLLGVTVLSEKSEALKAQIKQIKEEIQIESTKITTIEESNKKIQSTIDSLKRKQHKWQATVNNETHSLTSALEQLLTIDVTDELEQHQLLEEYNLAQTNKKSLEERQKTTVAQYDKLLFQINKIKKDLKKLETKCCYTCGQSIENANELIEAKTRDLDTNTLELNKLEQELVAIDKEIAELSIPTKPTTFYPDVHQVYEHKNNIQNIESQLESIAKQTDPYCSQIEELESQALQPIDWTIVNELSQYREHQEFLLKLLTNKDSFIRKKIIDQNLTYLNNRLTYYLTELGLPHQVEFINDLSVNISQFGQELDFDNLSRGERSRLILGLCFSFRDVWESLRHHINLLCVDELIDAGLDGAGIDSALRVLKQISRDRKKNVFLISHRAELTSRVENILKVIKENGFTTFEQSME